MGKRGPKGRPPLEIVREGNPGKRPPKEVVQPEPGAPDEPKWAEWFTSGGNRDRQAEMKRAREVASAVWQHHVPRLERIGLLSTTDLVPLRDFCICWARLDQLERHISRTGMTLLDDKGVRRRNPVITPANQYRQMLIKYVDRFGLAPSVRAGAELPGDAGDGPNQDAVWDV